MLTLVLNIGFLLMLKKPKEGSDTMTKITILLKEKRPHLGWREVYGFSSMFWSLLTISFWVGASWNPFMHQASDERAAWEASIMLAVPLIAYPFLGTFIDYAGKRAWLLLMTAGLLVLTHILLMMPYPTIAIPPTIPMLLFALSLSFGTLSIVTSMPILTKHVPTGLGLHRSIDNIGATLFGTVAGMMQDSVNTGVDEESKTENFFDRLYHHFFPKKVNLIQQEKEDLQLIGLFLFVAIAAFAASAVFVWGDYHWRDGKDGKTGLVNGVYGRQAKTPSRQRSRRRWTRTRVANVARGEDGVAVLEPFTMEPVFDLEDEPDAEELSMADISSNATRPRPTDGDYSSEDPHFLDTHSLDQTTEWSRLHPQADEEDQSADDEESLDESGENRFGVRIDSGDDDIPLYKKRQAHFWILVWSMMLLVSWVVFAVGLAK
ncbi:hypothetical protein BGW38_007777 [Lunasporangiospora selenospora]|uniref:Major Facilitator Superfamily protein n=1 Tax=Lunasporangiospora selenospora TaxID=979761 RepID=A0A9P6FZH3_9FUNG|nr:hypothetical protein BGW38_007777 [Lunasporangiospora selenospora]